MTSYDESIEVLDGEEMRTPRKEEKDMGERRPRTAKMTSANLRPPPSGPESRPTSRRMDTMEADEERNLSPETTDVEGEEEEESQSQPPQLDGAYNPNDYEGLNVSPEVREIFSYINAYTPADMNSFLDVKLKPFIPEYYPSVGDIDAFIKVIDEDLFDEGLGIRYLDEASAFQSDPSVLDLRLRSMAKQSSAKAALVKKVENVSKNGKVIENWIKDISDLHRSKPSPSVYYSKPMPELDGLLEEWPQEVEEAMGVSSLPPPNIHADLNTYVDIVCGLLDIPVYKSRIQSLHLLATLYSTMKRMNEYGTNSTNNINQSIDRLEF